ncbi:MAG: 4-(cytidine 5'-diphospho)-2-C-methyl-D-erythritol kinase [Oscillospiraceae bacterium]|nr:4-(cytidine 5'-diphospho)-2-C-methyl-D-erythritol kinase [Oscillospiraceae bacterium]
MDKLTVCARAKINLSLDVLGKMDDGYHEILSVMQSVELHDDIQLTAEDGNGYVRARSSRSFLPRDDRNIAGKAVRLFLNETDIKGKNVDVYIVKRNPVCAGLGGGSADGAAVLRGLDEIFGTGLSDEELMAMGEKLGADVAFCVMGGTALAKGKGEILTPLPKLPESHVVICKPAFAVSTPVLFAAVDSRKIRFHPDTKGMVKAIEEGSLNGVAKRLFNVFEEMVAEDHSEIQSIKDTLYDCGALGASMSGTGSAMFGLFDSREKAQAAYDKLSRIYKETFLTKTV